MVDSESEVTQKPKTIQEALQMYAELERAKKRKEKKMANNNDVQFESVDTAQYETEELRPLEDMFEDAKNGFLMTVETNIETAERIAFLMWVRDQAYKFWGNMFDEQFVAGERLDYFRKLQSICVETYEKIAEVAKTFDLDEFKKEEMKDYFAGIVPAVSEIKTEAAMLEAELIFLSVQPYGSKMNQIHNLVMYDAEKQEAVSK